MKFIGQIENFVDAQDYYGEVYKVKDQTGLTKVAQHMFDKAICKYEQMSNWAQRPLRESQQHYGALDGWILIEIVKKLKELSELKTKEIDINFSKKNPELSVQEL